MGTRRPLEPGIESSIVIVRGLRVMLDVDLARLYGVEVKALNQAVKRNAARFPEDFMLRLEWPEIGALRSQTVTLAGAALGPGRHSKYRPHAFTEQGVAMLSSVLRSDQAIRVNIEIMRAFVRLRAIAGLNRELARRLDALEAKYDSKFKVVFDAIRQLMTPPMPTKKRRIGFVTDD